ncbi:MAG: TetR/AcrR family transcriptional regulator [Polyangiaceae bacterium]
MARILNSRSSKAKTPTKRARTTPRKQPTQSRSQATVEAILSATARILVRDGYEHASTNRVAEEAGVSVGSLYQYFPGKEALVAALIDVHRAKIMDLLRSKLAEVADESPRVATRALVSALVDAHAIEPKLHRVFAEQLPRVGRLRQRIEDVQVTACEMVRPYLELHRDKVRPRDLDLATFVVVHTVEALAHSGIVDAAPPIDRETLTDEITDIVIRYLVE